MVDQLVVSGGMARLGGCSLERRVVGFCEPAVITEIRSLLHVNYATDLKILQDMD